MVFLSGLDNSINGRLIRFAGEDLRWASRAGLGIGFVGCLHGCRYFILRLKMLR